MKKLSSKQHIVPQVPMRASIAPVGAGILHPKFSHQFIVRFGAELTPNSSVNETKATELLNHLTTQVANVKFPIQQLNVICRAAPAATNFKSICTDGIFSFAFEDDIGNCLQDALEFLCGSDCEHLKVLIAKVDGTGTLEAWYANDLKMQTLEHTDLNYALSSHTVQKVLTVSSQRIQRSTWKYGPVQPTVEDLIKQLF